jgi:spore coat protein JA
VSDIHTSYYRGVYVPYGGSPKVFVLPPPIWWQKQPVYSPEFTPETAFVQGSVWPMLVDGFSKEEGIS